MNHASSKIQHHLAKTSSQNRFIPLWKAALDSKERRLSIDLPRATPSPHEDNTSGTIKDEMVRTVFPPLRAPQMYSSSKTDGHRDFRTKSIAPAECSSAQAGNGHRMHRHSSSSLRHSSSASSSSEFAKSGHVLEESSQKYISRKVQNTRPKRAASQVRSIQGGEDVCSVISAIESSMQAAGKRDGGAVRRRSIPMRSTSWQDRGQIMDTPVGKQSRVVRHRGSASCNQPAKSTAQKLHGRRGGESCERIRENLASTSSSVSSEESLIRDEYENYWAAKPEDVLRKFDLQMGNKSSLVDRSGKHEALAGFALSAAVSCIGRSNGSWKKENQDTFMIEANRRNDMVMLGVFDGHGENGGIASKDVKNQLILKLRESNGILWNQIKQDPEQAIKKAFADIDVHLGRRNEDFSRSGTTAVIVVVDTAWTVVAWVGDSRAVRGEKMTKSNSSHIRGVNMSRDHKPEDYYERKRILANNGRIDRMVVDSKGTRAGPNRVYLKYAWQPGLATSRSFGDTMAKIVGVISEPEFDKHTLHVTDEVIIVASDGVWEVISTQEAVEIAKSYTTPSEAANSLVATSLHRWVQCNQGRVCDDITALVCFLDHKKRPKDGIMHHRSALSGIKPLEPLFPCVG